MTSGASVWPTKMLAAVDRLSAPEHFIVFCMIDEKKLTMTCMMPR